jgi:hypothetical protein
MNTNTYLEQLGREHGFTLAELEANRQGALHPAQLARGTRKGIASLIVLAVLGVLALGGGLVGAYVFYDGLGPNPSSVDLNAVYAIGGAGVVFGLVFFVCARISFVRCRARKAAFVSARIDVLEGPMNKTHISGRGVPHQYIFRVGGRSFHTSEKLWELLTQGAHYRLYCVADQLLTFEPGSAESVSTASRQMATRAVGATHT